MLWAPLRERLPLTRTTMPAPATSTAAIHNTTPRPGLRRVYAVKPAVSRINATAATTVRVEPVAERRTGVRSRPRPAAERASVKVM
jgi:hypothetical protein